MYIYVYVYIKMCVCVYKFGVQVPILFSELVVQNLKKSS